MFTHSQIWLGVDKLAKRYGFSPSGLAKKAGLDPTSFNKSKRISSEGKPRWPSTESISKILIVCNSNLEEFSNLVSQEEEITKDYIASQVAKALLDTESVLFNAKEPFTLKSGRSSPVYIDVRRLISFVSQRQEIIRYGAQLLSDTIGLSKIDCIAGGETAGIPYGAFLAQKLNKPMVYVRKEPKGYGRMAQIEGSFDGVLAQNQTSSEHKTQQDNMQPRTLLVEDLQTDGGSKRVFVQGLRNAGAIVEDAFVVFHYGIFEKSLQNMKELGINLHALCTWYDVLAVARDNNYLDENTLNAVELFLQDPMNWSAQKENI